MSFTKCLKEGLKAEGEDTTWIFHKDGKEVLGAEINPVDDPFIWSREPLAAVNFTKTKAT